MGYLREELHALCISRTPPAPSRPSSTRAPVVDSTVAIDETLLTTTKLPATTVEGITTVQPTTTTKKPAVHIVATIEEQSTNEKLEGAYSARLLGKIIEASRYDEMTDVFRELIHDSTNENNELFQLDIHLTYNRGTRRGSILADISATDIREDDVVVDHSRSRIREPCDHEPVALSQISDVTNSANSHQVASGLVFGISVIVLTFIYNVR